MAPHSKPRRAHLFVAAGVAATITLACGYSAAHEAPPTEKVPFESVVGTWQGGSYTIEFHEDGTFALTSDASEFAPLRDEGTWTLCEDYPYEEFGEEGIIVIDCVEAEAGEWIQFHHPETRTIDFPWRLIFTGDEELKLYAYNIDTGVEDDLFYSKYVR
ncbi:hypothetical protein [Glycomyces tenuis]|uniref:hypothetical protein n=1 Tax=Glycomyces tenuis TaxID=58116 RepID=UPI00042773D6|nr:hypothetical protein [Glycomyces tenuis]